MSYPIVLSLCFPHFSSYLGHRTDVIYSEKKEFKLIHKEDNKHKMERDEI